MESLPLIAVLATALATFPGRVHESRSPNRSAVVKWVEAEGENPHRLILSAGRTETELLRFPRSVTLAWSPDSKFIAVTDRVGSDQSALHLFSVETPKREIRIHLPKEAAEILEANHHAYAEVLGWRGHHFRVRVRGYGAKGSREQSINIWCEASGECQ